jgi:hypothetical protein
MSSNPYIRELEEVLEVQEEVLLEDVEGIEKDLIRLGYMPLSKILVETEGLKYAKYIKTLNLHGQKVYVELDVEGTVFIEDTDIPFVEQQSGIEIPLIEPYQCVQGKVCGVLSECEGSICTLVREPDSHYPKQIMYYRPDETTFVAGKIAYPIVRLSSILSNPSLALQSQYETSARLRNQKNALEVQKLDDIATLLNLAVSEFNEYQRERETLATEVYQSIRDLEDQNQTYVDHLEVTPLEQAERKALVMQLKNRNEIVVDILKCSERVAQTRDLLEKVIATFDQAKRECLKQANT